MEHSGFRKEWKIPLEFLPFYRLLKNFPLARLTNGTPIESSLLLFFSQNTGNSFEDARDSLTNAREENINDT